MKTFKDVFGVDGPEGRVSLRGIALSQFGVRGNANYVQIEQDGRVLFDSFVPSSKGFAVKKRRFWHKRFRVLPTFGGVKPSVEGGFYDFEKPAKMTVTGTYDGSVEIELPAMRNSEGFAVIIVRGGPNQMPHYYAQQ